MAATASATRAPGRCRECPRWRRRCHPVTAVHLGVGVEHLVVELASELELLATEEDDRDPGVEQGADHQPAEPYLVPEELDDADRRVLGLDQPQRRVTEDDEPHREQSGCGDE